MTTLLIARLTFDEALRKKLIWAVALLIYVEHARTPIVTTFSSCSSNASPSTSTTTSASVSPTTRCTRTPMRP